MFFDEFLNIEPNNKQLSSRIFHIREILDQCDDVLEPELFKSVDTITNLSKKFDERRIAFENIKKFKDSKDINYVFFIYVFLNIFYEDLIKKKYLVNEENFLVLNFYPHIDFNNLNTFGEYEMLNVVVESIKNFLFDKAILFLKDQPVVEDKIKVNLLDEEKRITNKEVEKYFDDFFTLAYHSFKSKETFISAASQTLKSESLSKWKESFHKYFIYDSYDICMKYLFPLYDYKQIFQTPKNIFFLKKFISPSIKKKNWILIKEILSYLVDKYKFYDASILLALIYQEKFYFISDGKNNINHAIKLYTTSFNNGDDLILIDNKEVNFHSNVLRSSEKIAIQLTKLYYKKNDFKNAKKWIKEAKFNLEFKSEIVQKNISKIKISRDLTDAFDRDDVQDYGEVLFYYALIENHSLSQKLSILWNSFQFLLNKKDIVLVEILKVYNQYFDEILSQKIYVSKEVLDQFKNRLKFYLNPKNELQLEVDFKLPKIKPEVLRYFDILISKKKKRHSSLLLGEEGENLEYKTSAYHPYPKFPDKINFKGTDLYVIGNKRFKNKHDVHQFIINQFLKTINGFLNANGGTLLIGVNEKDNSKNVVGIEYDLSQTNKFSSADKYVQFIQQTIENRLIPEEVINNIKVSLIKYGKKNLCEIKVRKLNRQRKPALIKVENAEIRIYQRRGNRTAEIPYAEQHRYF